MKLTLEPSDQHELEVILRGDLNDPQVARIITALNTAKAISRLFLYQDEKEYLYPVEDIRYIEANRNKIFAVTTQGRMEARHKLYELADMLHGSGFIQINKGMIVNVHTVQSVEAEFSGNYIATLNDRKTRLSISRKYFKAFRDFVTKEL